MSLSCADEESPDPRLAISCSATVLLCQPELGSKARLFFAARPDVRKAGGVVPSRPRRGGIGPRHEGCVRAAFRVLELRAQIRAFRLPASISISRRPR